MLIKQSTANKVIPFFMVDSTDHITGKTGLTPTVTIAKNGAAFGTPAGAVAEIGSGWYRIAANATDSNTLGALLVHATSAGADPFDVIHEVVAFDVDASTVVVGTNNDKTGYALTSLYDAAKTAASQANVATELTTYGAVKPTVAGRTLDISTTGEAGIDWANIGAPTTTQNLSATTISTSQAVASVSGAVGSVTGAVASVTNPVALTSSERSTLAGVIWNILTSTLTTAGSVGKLLVDNLNATISSRSIAGDAMTLTSGERTTLAGVIWGVLTSTLTTASTIGKLIVDNLNATVSSRSTYAGTDTPGTTTLLSRIPSTPAVPGDAMTLTSGERTTLAGSLWNALTSGLTTVGSIGKLLVDNINATIASRSTYAGTDTSGTTTLLARIPSALTITGGAVSVSDKTGFALTSVYDPAKTAATQTSVDTIDDFVDTEVAAIKAVTDKLNTALEVDGPVWRYTANSLEQAPTGSGGSGATDWSPSERDQIRYRLGIDGSSAAPITAPSLASQASVDTISAKTNNLPALPAAKGDAMTLTPAYDAAKTASTQASVNTIAGYVDTEVGAIKVTTDKLDTALEADGGVWRYTANALENAPIGGGGGATDWSPGERDQIRHRLGIDGTASTPAATPSLSTQSSVNAIAAKTNQLNFIAGDVRSTLDGEVVVINQADIEALADEILKRDWTDISGEAEYSLLNAARMLRNVWATEGGTLVVMREDGTTQAWSRLLTTDPEAQPIVAAT